MEIQASALSDYSYRELEPFWRDLLRHPNPLMRHYAVFGLSMCGEAADTVAIRSANLPRAYDPDQGIKALASARLRVSLESRDTLTFDSSPAPDGRFVPSQAWLRSARRYLCETGRCPEERR